MIFLSKVSDEAQIAKHMNSLFVRVGNKQASKYPPSEVTWKILEDCKLYFNKWRTY